MNALETYLRELSVIRSSGSAVPETSYYPVLSNLLNEVGSELKPKVRCIINIKNRGAGIPDGGLFTPDQFQRPSEAEPLPGQIPARGVIEAKPTSDDAWVKAEGKQVRDIGANTARFWSQISVISYLSALMPRGSRSSSKTTASRRMRQPFGAQQAIHEQSQPSKVRDS